MDKAFDFGQINLNIRRRVYKSLGAGSGRIVFDLGNGYVVKAAKNIKGLAQNKAEYEIALADHTDLFAKIAGVSERYELLIMEKADRIKNISFVWDYFNVGSNKELYRIKQLQDISVKHDLVLVDFGRISNWGQINRKPVIIDYGFTRQVRRRFYMPLLLQILGV